MAVALALAVAVLAVALALAVAVLALALALAVAVLAMAVGDVRQLLVQRQGQCSGRGST